METVFNSRRNFIRLISLSSLALTLPGFRFLNKIKPKAQIGIQLYTVRREIETELEKVVQRIAEIGYEGIETYPLPENITVKHAAKVFRKNKLEVFSMHTDLPEPANFDAIVRMAEEYKCNRVVYPGWPEGEKYRDVEGIKRTTELYNTINESLRKEGLEFGLHNHWWEFETHDEVIPFYYLLENLDKSIFFEIDTYWVKTAGLDPSKVLKDFGSRAPLLHIKDGPAEKGDNQYNMVPAGKGSLDFESIVEAGADNTKWLIIEFDEYKGEILEGIEESYKYMNELG